MTISLLLSVLVHALVLRMELGGHGWLPGFSAWQDRPIVAPDLRVELVPAPVKAMEPETPPVATPVRNVRIEPPAPPPRAPKPAAPARTAVELVAEAKVPEAAPRAEAPPPNPARAAKEAAGAKAEPVADTRDDSLPRPNPLPELLATERDDEPSWVVPAAAPEPPPKAEPSPQPVAATPLPDVGEAERAEKARLEAEAAVKAAALEEEARKAAAREEAARLEAARIERERVEAERAQAARAEAARLEAERAEAARVEAARVEAERQEAARLAAEKLEAERREAARIVAERLEAERRETARIEMERREAERREAARLEAERLEAARLEAAKARAEQEAAARREAERRELARRQEEEAGRRRLAEAAAPQPPPAAPSSATPAAQPQQPARPTPEEEAEAKRAEVLRRLGRQLDEEADRRDAAKAAASRLPLSVSSARRYRLFGRTDPNAEIILYAEAWSRKIQLNMTMDMVRSVAAQPHTDPVVTVAIRSDGSVESLKFVRSSGVAAIDAAIQGIVESQAPYRVFPPALAREYDVIEIRRTWHFDVAVRLY